jgi:hypothetical protein
MEGYWPVRGSNPAPATNELIKIKQVNRGAWKPAPLLFGQLSVNCPRFLSARVFSLHCCGREGQELGLINRALEVVLRAPHCVPQIGF